MAEKKKTNEMLNPLDQIKSYIKEHKDEHFNFEKTTKTNAERSCIGTY